MISRRTMLTSAMLAGTALATAGAIRPGTADATPVGFTLPRPTGPHAVGTASLHLVDPARTSPWVTPTRPRELMVSLWYPTHRRPTRPQPWLPPAVGDVFLASVGLDRTAITLPNSHAGQGLPVCRQGRLPVVLYSPGWVASRFFNTVVVEQLASHGYLVATVDHTHESPAVEFPGGRVELGQAPPGTEPVFTTSLDTRVPDLRFVLDRLADLDRGANPDAEGRPLPTGLRGGLDLGRIGMIGHSLGGATTASTMYADRRVKAGVSLDGSALGPVVDAGLDRPYLVMDTPGKGGMAGDARLRTFFSHLTGWRLALTLRNSAHQTYGDLELLYPVLGPLVGVDPTEEIGTIPTARAIAVQQTYPLAFFDRHLRGRGHLLDGPSPNFPEVMFQRT